MTELPIPSRNEEDGFLEIVWRGGAWNNSMGFHASKIQEMFLDRISNINLDTELQKCRTELDRIKLIKQYFEWVPVDQDLRELKRKWTFTCTVGLFLTSQE